MNHSVWEAAGKEYLVCMYHNFMEGNIVRSKKDGQLMTIKSISKNPFDGKLSGYAVCTWLNQYKEKKTKNFHVDDLEFVSIGDINPYNIDKN